MPVESASRPALRGFARSGEFCNVTVPRARAIARIMRSRGPKASSASFSPSGIEELTVSWSRRLGKPLAEFKREELIGLGLVLVEINPTLGIRPREGSSGMNWRRLFSPRSATPNRSILTARSSRRG
jgi:hypothetical protein